MCELVVARSSASVTVGVGRRTIRKGTVLCADDPMVAGRGGLFEPLEVKHHCAAATSVEQATAAPGEVRTMPPPAVGETRPARRRRAEQKPPADPGPAEPPQE